MKDARKIVERIPADGDLTPMRYFVEGPLEERREVETPWGNAWAEVGTYVFEEVTEDGSPGAKHIHVEEDFERQYR